MRLTNTLREAIIKSILADVPTEDYDSKIRELAQKAVLAVAPKCVQETFKVNPLLLDTCYLYGLFPLRHQNHFVRGAVGSFMETADASYKAWPVSDDHRIELIALREAYAAQIERLTDIESKLKGVVYSVTTTNKLCELLPEFDKYIPKDEEKTAGVPALANLVTDLMAAGWPKGKTA